MTTLMSALVVRSVVRFLPAGARARYRREFLGELAACRRGARVRFALGVLTSVFALRAALAGSALLVSPVEPPSIRSAGRGCAVSGSTTGSSATTTTAIPTCVASGAARTHFELRPRSQNKSRGQLFGQWPA